MKSPKYWIVALSVCAVTATVHGEEQKTRPCQEAAQYVAQNMNQLPKDFAAFTSLPVSHRKAVYKNLSAEERADLWQTQWQSALEKNDLTEEQRGLLFEASQLMTPSTFSTLQTRKGLRYDATMRLIANLEQRAIAAFGKGGTAELFAQIGPIHSQKVVLVDGKIAPTSSIISGEACSCSQSSDYCPDSYGCSTDGDGCTIIEDECGFLWTYNCNGECLQAQ